MTTITNNKLTDEQRWCPDVDPITRYPLFMWINHPELGYVPTYGGPYDSYTLTERDENGEFYRHEYVQDNPTAELQERRKADNQEPAGYHVIKECGKVGCSVATLEEAEKTRDFWNKKWTIRPYFYTAQPAPAVIQSSQLLHDFYRAYADWLISGGDGQFSCVNGLCANLFDYCDRKGVGSAQALNEMHVQFVTAGMNEKLPFNTSVTDFDAESADGKCHLNTARRKWVFRRIIDGVKPAPVVPLSITLPDTSSKAFWSGTGKKEVFHPETYKRWVKEAIERFCMIAGIAVEVKS